MGPELIFKNSSKLSMSREIKNICKYNYSAIFPVIKISLKNNQIFHAKLFYEIGQIQKR